MFVSFLSRNTTYKFLKSVCLHLEVFAYPNVPESLVLPSVSWSCAAVFGIIPPVLEVTQYFAIFLINRFISLTCDTPVSLAKQQKND